MIAADGSNFFIRINPGYYIYQRYNITHLTGKKAFGLTAEKKNHAKEPQHTMPSARASLSWFCQRFVRLHSVAAVSPAG